MVPEMLGRAVEQFGEVGEGSGQSVNLVDHRYVHASRVDRLVSL